MRFIDAQTLSGPIALETDVCIVGSGAAGITLAVALARAGTDVLLIESGGLAPQEATQSLYDLESVGYPVRENYMSRARYFGGSCNLWAGRSMQLNEQDFVPRGWVPDSGWPLAAAELARWYPEAGRILGLPDAAREQRRANRMLESGSERALFADGVLVPTVSLWAPSAKRFGASFRSELTRSRTAKVLLNASVTQLQLDAQDLRIESLVALTLGGARLAIRARRFVLACGGLENARLLLVSQDRQPAGIGNQHDLVGRFFMDHPRTVFGKVHAKAGVRFPLLRGKALSDGKLQLGMALSPRMQASEGLLNHYLTLESQSSGYTEAKYQAAIQTMKVALRRGYAGSRWDLARGNLSRIPDMIYMLSPKELMPHRLYRMYAAMRDALPQRKPRSYVIVYFCEQPPTPDSRVTLDSRTDRLGMRRLRLHWSIPDSVTRTVLRMQDLLAKQVVSSGMGELEPGRDTPTYTDASHHIGTTRMSDRPETGVVDRQCRVHGVENLYLAGSSVFPCAGHANPTLTIVALALRLAAHLRGVDR